MSYQQCPRCEQRTCTRFAGGERGEAGNFLYCASCDYDEEEEQNRPFRQRATLIRYLQEFIQPDDLTMEREPFLRTVAIRILAEIGE